MTWPDLRSPQQRVPISYVFPDVFFGKKRNWWHLLCFPIFLGAGCHHRPWHDNVCMTNSDCTHSNRFCFLLLWIAVGIGCLLTFFFFFTSAQPAVCTLFKRQMIDPSNLVTLWRLQPFDNNLLASFFLMGISGPLLYIRPLAISALFDFRWRIERKKDHSAQKK